MGDDDKKDDAGARGDGDGGGDAGGGDAGGGDGEKKEENEILLDRLNPFAGKEKVDPHDAKKKKEVEEQEKKE